MGAYTTEELHSIRLMRRQEQADQERETEQWNAVGQGYSETDTDYRIQYQIGGSEPTWYSASPFYEPLSTHPDWTHDKDRASDIADLLLAGKWAVDKQGEPGDRYIVAVRVTEAVHTTKIAYQRRAPLREGLSGRIID